MPGEPWNNVELPRAPTPLSYGPPLIGAQLGQMLGNLPADFVQGQQLGVQSRMMQPIQGNPLDPQNVLSQLNQRGGLQAVMPLAGPIIKRQVGADIYNRLTGGQGGDGQSQGGGQDIYGAVLDQESGNRDTVGDSSAGAVGPGQIMPDTWKQYAQQGEDIRKPDDNRRVSKRILDDYLRKFDGDVPRALTAYYSGPGNVAPVGSTMPWIENIQPKNGPSTARYVAQTISRMDPLARINGGQLPQPQGPQTAQAAGGPAPTPRGQSGESADVPGPSTTSAAQAGTDSYYTPQRAQTFESTAARLRQQAGALEASGFKGDAQNKRADDLERRAAEIRRFLSEQRQKELGVDIAGRTRGAEELDTARGKRVASIIEKGTAASDSISTIDAMADAVRAGGGEFGPTSPYWLKFKEAINAWHPGTFKDVAASEVLPKLNEELAGELSKSLGARGGKLDIDPALMGTREGTLAMLDLLRQSKQRDINLGRAAMNIAHPREWQQVEDNFYNDPKNQLISPFTGQPIVGGRISLRAPAAPASTAPAGAPTTTPAAIPARPASVPPGSQYSPSRNQWRAPSGRLFNASGQPVT